MNINWKLRIKNKTTLTAILAAVVALVYSIAGLVDTFPDISQESLWKCIEIVVEILVLLGIVVDPTTSGVSDSERAMGYSDPKKDLY